MNLSPEALCPCGSNKKYISCCGAFHHGEIVPTAEALMRARYAAYVVADINFIEKTTHPKIMSEFDFQASKDWAEKAKWLGLKVLEVEAGTPSDNKGAVSFEAHFEMAGKNEIYAERAQFERSGPRNTWFFCAGDPIGSKPIVRSEPKHARNLPCACGSGKKYKKCCGQ